MPRDAAASARGSCRRQLTGWWHNAAIFSLRSSVVLHSVAFAEPDRFATLVPVQELFAGRARPVLWMLTGAAASRRCGSSNERARPIEQSRRQLRQLQGLLSITQ